MKEVVLIDGNSLLFRAYFAMRPMVTSKGIHTQGVFAFINMLNKILKDYEPKHLAVAFDMKGGTFRHEKYSEYKAGRQQTPPELLSQIPLMHRVLEAMNIAVLEKEKYEADDIIGTIASAASREGLSTLIITGDKDELQLIDENVNVLITKKGLSEFDIYDLSAMRERYGLTPSQFIDLKGLMGDSSDNIPGVSGIGEKKGLALLHEYESLENVICHADEIKGKMGENIRANIDIARLSKWLATINRESPIDFTWEDLRLGAPDYAKLIDIYTELEFNQFIKQLGSISSAAGDSLNIESDSSEALRRGFESIEIVDRASFFNKTKSGSEVFIELATDNSHTDTPLVRAGALYNPEDNIACMIESELEIMTLASSLAEAGYRLSGCGLHKVVYSLISMENRRLDTCFDNTVAEYLLNPSAQKYPLDKLLLRHSGYVATQEEAELLSDEANHNTANISAEGCLKRAFYSHVVKDNQEKLLDENEIRSLFESCEMPLVMTLSSMEYEGIKCDSSVLKSIGGELIAEIEGLEKEIYHKAGREFNINSPKQLGQILFDEMSIPYPKQKAKSGSYSTAADILDKLKDDYDIVSDILNYRKLTKLNSTYVEGLLPLISSEGRVHPHFQQTVTATGRLSCTEPNLQNIPIRDEYGRLIRKAFIASDEESLFTGSDYSQIELRILASLSGDESLISDFREGKDIHKSTAARVFGLKEEEVTSLDRTKAKAVNFGVVYGMSGFGLGESLSISRSEGQKYINDYFIKHEAVKNYLDDRIKEGETKREVRTYFGRLRQLPEFASSKFMEREAAKRLAMNTPVQGTAADIIKIAMNSVYDELDKRGLESRLILQIHDELIVEGPESEAAEVRQILDSCMRNAASLAVDLVCEIHSGKTWYDLK
ncbi:MAG: DNA polymerase I [Mogibacterium sp.]|nr:DNA polymerase I [Mogibacterium sp.]